MKNVYEVLRQKELELTRLEKEVEALRVAAPLLSDEKETLAEVPKPSLTATRAAATGADSAGGCRPGRSRSGTRRRLGRCGQALAVAESFRRCRRRGLPRLLVNSRIAQDRNSFLGYYFLLAVTLRS